MVRFFAILCAVLLCVAAFSACTSDCIYKTFESNDGGELCGRFCPKEDEEGNEILDDDGEPVYEREDIVDKTNCILPTSTTSTASSSSSTSN